MTTAEPSNNICTTSKPYLVRRPTSGQRLKHSLKNSTQNFTLRLTLAHSLLMLSAKNTSRLKTMDYFKIGGGEVVFCNPPYGKAIRDWVFKCWHEAQKPNTTVVALLPARTDTTYFHKYIYNRVKEIRFIKGRLKFGDSKNSAPFPSMIVIF